MYIPLDQEAIIKMTTDAPVTPEGYKAFLRDLKGRIRKAQLRASLSVNRELVLLYWNIGKDILERQRALGWGAKVIERLASDLRTAFPEMKGFSSRCAAGCCTNPLVPQLRATGQGQRPDRTALVCPG